MTSPLAPSLCLLAALGLAGCAAATDADTTADQGQAIGERWWSPVEVGTYDADDASLAITSTLQGQRVAYSAPAYFLAGAVSRDGDGGVKVLGDENGGTLRARPDGNNLVVSLEASGLLEGAAGLTFVRREPNAVAGRYSVPGPGGATLDVRSSNEDALGLRITHQGRTVEMRGRRPRWPFRAASSYDLGNDYDGCTVTVTRARGAFALEVTPALDAECKLPKGPYGR